MKNNIWFFIVCIMSFLIGYNMNNVAVSFPKYKVAVIDIQTIMQKSSDIQQLKTEQDKDIQELNKLISKAQNELLNETDKSLIIKKEADYQKQIDEQKNKIDKTYTDKLAKINESIKNIISNEAAKSNYNLVLPTGMVISGGEDITQKVITQIK